MVLKYVNPNTTATFAGGCFWGLEKWFKKEFGSALLTSAVGYIGDSADSAVYRAVCSGQTNHAEALQVTFDQDPTTFHRQGNDVGPQYRSAIFAHTADQQQVAREVLNQMNRDRYNGRITTTIELVPVDQFFKGESKHQGYLDKNPNGYCNHRPRW